MTLTFEERGNVHVAVSPTTGFTYEVHDKWKMPRGVGYAVFVRDCATGKSVTGNTAAFYSKSTDPSEAKAFCEKDNEENNNA